MGIAVSLVTFFAAAKKVTAAPHRGNANRPKTKRDPARTQNENTSKPAPQKTPSKKPPVPKSTEKLDLATRAAWLYYVAGNTQNEIAEKLQISRPVAQRLVAFAVEKNLIRVRVDHRIADCLSLAKALSDRYGLAMCEV